VAPSHLGAGTFLILEGGLVGALVLMRALVVRSIDPDDLPAVIRRRVRLGNRLTPAFAVLASVLLAVGVLLVTRR
jgi:hypothetical protein